MDLGCLNTQDGAGFEIFRVIGANVARGGLEVIVGGKHAIPGVDRADGTAVIVNWAALAGLPAQNQTLEVIGLVNQIPRVSGVAKLNVRLDLAAFRLQVEDESAKVGQFHAAGGAFELIQRGNEVHGSKVRSAGKKNQVLVTL